MIFVRGKKAEPFPWNKKICRNRRNFRRGLGLLLPHFSFIFLAFSCYSDDVNERKWSNEDRPNVQNVIILRIGAESSWVGHSDRFVSCNKRSYFDINLILVRSFLFSEHLRIFWKFMAMKNVILRRNCENRFQALALEISFGLFLISRLFHDIDIR